MFVLIVSVTLAILFTLFAIQNTAATPLKFLSYTATNIPLYLIILGSLLLGLLVAWVLSLINGITSSLSLHASDEKVKDTKKKLNELTKQFHQLELENAKLKAKDESERIDEKSI